MSAPYAVFDRMETPELGSRGFVVRLDFDECNFPIGQYAVIGWVGLCPGEVGTMCLCLCQRTIACEAQSLSCCKENHFPVFRLSDVSQPEHRLFFQAQSGVSEVNRGVRAQVSIPGEYTGNT